MSPCNCNVANKTLHLTAIPMQSKAAGQLLSLLFAKLYQLFVWLALLYFAVAAFDVVRGRASSATSAAASAAPTAPVSRPQRASATRRCVRTSTGCSAQRSHECSQRDVPRRGRLSRGARAPLQRHARRARPRSHGARRGRREPALQGHTGQADRADAG